MSLSVHSRSVVHGDLSGVRFVLPTHDHNNFIDTCTLQSNVLIRESGKACIADFGLSMLLTELGGSTFATSFQARGTLRWTAPELLDLEVPEDDMEESPCVVPTTQSDVYSFGGVMLQVRRARSSTYHDIYHIHVDSKWQGAVSLLYA